MNCDKCNVALPENAKYCHKCGGKIQLVKDDNIEIIEEKNKLVAVLEEKNTNIISKNPETTGALLLGIAACAIMFVKSGGFFSIILVIFAARRLLKAKKEKENKKYIYFSYIVVYLPVLVWILSSIVFAINAVNSVM